VKGGESDELEGRGSDKHPIEGEELKEDCREGRSDCGKCFDRV